MSSYNCHYCKKEYSNNKSLKVHQKTTKFCIEIQKGLENKPNDNTPGISSFKCEYCNDNFTVKSNLQRHYDICKIHLKKIQEENELKKNTEILELNKIIEKLKDNFQTQKEEFNNYKAEIIFLKKELKMKDEYHLKEQKMKDEIISKLEKENESLKKDSKETIKSFFEKEEKIRDTLLHENNSIKKSPKTVNNIINNTTHYNNIKPLTSDSIINAFESYQLKHENAFNAYRYDSNGLAKFELELVFYGIVRELKEYYGITDISREKIVYNNNGEITLTTVQEFIRTNVVMNNIDIILEWITNLRTQIFKKLEDGFTITNEGEIKDLDNNDKKRLHEKEQTLMNIYELFRQSKERGDIHMYISDEMSLAAMRHGITVEKPKGKIKKLTDSR